MIESLLLYVLTTLQLAFGIVLLYWWVWAPVLLFMVFWGNLESFNRAQYLSGLKWTILELRPPRETRHSPKAMEQVFLGFHALPGMPKPPKNLKESFNAMRDRVFKGKVPEWFSLEIVGTGGEMRLYIRVLEQYRNLVESQIYAHYPEAEVIEVPDYMSSLPSSLPNEEFDLTGSNVGLNKEDAFPIRTYEDFEEAKGNKDDAVRIDPIAPLAETLSTVGIGEHLAIQFLLRSSDDSWIKKSQAVMDKLFDKPAKVEVTGIEKALSSFEKELAGLAGAAPTEKKEEKKEPKPFNQLNPGTQDVIKAIERSFSKLGFQTGIRILYVARRDRFNPGRKGSLMAALRVFSTQAMNGFKSEFDPEVKKGRKKEEKTFQNKSQLYKEYRQRAYPKKPKPFVLTTEELATVYHFPDVEVKTPAVSRVEAKKGEPPSSLPTV